MGEGPRNDVENPSSFVIVNPLNYWGHVERRETSFKACLEIEDPRSRRSLPSDRVA